MDMEFKQDTVLSVNEIIMLSTLQKIKKNKKGNYHAFGTFEGNILRFMGFFFYLPPKARAFSQPGNFLVTTPRWMHLKRGGILVKL
jgi:hypothetical protein